MRQLTNKQAGTIFMIIAGIGASISLISLFKLHVMHCLCICVFITMGLAGHHLYREK